MTRGLIVVALCWIGGRGVGQLINVYDVCRYAGVRLKEKNFRRRLAAYAAAAVIDLSIAAALLGALT